MKKDAPTPWAYRRGKGILYRLPAGLKLLCLLGLSLAFFFFDYFFLPPAGLVLALLGINAGIQPRELLRGSASLFVLCGGIILYQSLELSPLALGLPGFQEGLLFSLRMILSFFAGALLFSTTTMGEILKSLARLEGLFRLKTPRLSLGISLMLGFLPRFFEIWEAAELAWKSRGGKNSLTKLITLVPIVMDRMIEKAAQTAEALESRGF